MYFYRIDTPSVLQSILDAPCIEIGPDHVVDIDDVEKKWQDGSVLFSIEYTSPITGTETVYYVMMPKQNKVRMYLDPNNTELDTQIDNIARPFLFLLEKRLQQRLRTRKIIKDYTNEAKRRSSKPSQENEILLGLLERAMPKKKGEEIYWFRDYEYALLAEAIKKTKQEITTVMTIKDILNKQYC